MPKKAEKWAELFGAKLVCEVPRFGGGVFELAHIARIMHERLTPKAGAANLDDPNWVVRSEVPMSKTTARRLARIARALSDGKRKVTPMQVAAQLLQDAIEHVKIKSA